MCHIFKEPGQTQWQFYGEDNYHASPAIDSNHTMKFWIKNSMIHRDDGPAIDCFDGHQEWYCYGVLHRDGEPAIIYANGTKEWYNHGILHREDGAAREYLDGSKAWFLFNQKVSEATFNTWLSRKDLKTFLDNTLPEYLTQATQTLPVKI